MKKRNTSGEVSVLVQEVLASLAQPWPEDVTDQVCLAIQHDRPWLDRYNQLVSQYGKLAVNCQIGRSTLKLTSLKNLGLRERATSSLIKTYTRLG